MTNPIPHKAVRNLLAAKISLDEADRRLSEEHTPYTTVNQALLAGIEDPQYLRTYVQGCVCKTGIAGGGCCPANAAVVAVHGADALPTMGHHLGSLPLAGVFLLLGGLGIYSGIRVLQISSDALDNLKKVDEALARQQDSLASSHQDHETDDKALKCEAQSSIKKQQDAIKIFRQAVGLSRREQRFNFAVLGLLQLTASTMATFNGFHQLGLKFLAPLGCGMLGSVSAFLFAVYAGVLAIKCFLTYAEDCKIAAMPIDQSQFSDSYEEALHRHLQARRKNQLKTALAWTAVAMVGSFSVMVGLAFGALPTTSLVAISLGVAIWAMWQSSHTRYLPHIPLSSHADPTLLADKEHRAKLWQILKAEDDAIKKAVEKIAHMQDSKQYLAYWFESIFKPQCGPKAFCVLPLVVAKTALGDDRQSQKRREIYESIVLEATKIFVEKERELLVWLYQEQKEALFRRWQELRPLVAPADCCGEAAMQEAEKALAFGKLKGLLYQQASKHLAKQASELEDAALKLAALDTLQKVLGNFEEHIGQLSSRGKQPQNEHQQNWLYSRILLMQLQGTLGDAIVTGKMVSQNPSFFGSLSNDKTHPINNVYVYLNKIDDFVTAMASNIDASFTHSFFNPHRTQGEMDFILEQELAHRRSRSSEQSGGQRSSVAPKSCCGGTT